MSTIEHLKYMHIINSENSHPELYLGFKKATKKTYIHIPFDATYIEANITTIIVKLYALLHNKPMSLTVSSYDDPDLPIAVIEYTEDGILKISCGEHKCTCAYDELKYKPIFEELFNAMCEKLPQTNTYKIHCSKILPSFRIKYNICNALSKGDIEPAHLLQYV